MRVFNIDTAINSPKGIKTFQELANSLISEHNPGDYNQSMMDIGASICTPKNPKCNQCPLNSICVVHDNNLIDNLPVKIKKTKINKINRTKNCFR